MKTNHLFKFLFVFVLPIGCKTGLNSTQSNPENASINEVKAPIREHFVLATIWQQHAVEFRALTYQAFNIAKMQLDFLLANQSDYNNPLAVITYIDETLLDNGALHSILIPKKKIKFQSKNETETCEINSYN